MQDTLPQNPPSCRNLPSSPAFSRGPRITDQPLQLHIVRPADLADLPFVKMLQAKLRESLGHISSVATEWRLQRGDVTAVEENAEIAGFILCAPRLKHAPWIHPIYQAAIHYDLRRRHHGFALVAAEEDKARAQRCSIVTLWCASDLEANDFWRAAGYTVVGVRTGGNRRARTHILWRKPLIPGALPLLWGSQRSPYNGPGGAYLPGNAARCALEAAATSRFREPTPDFEAARCAAIVIPHQSARFVPSGPSRQRLHGPRHQPLPLRA